MDNYMGDLLSFVNAFRSGETFARAIFIQLVDALKYSHAKKFAHLDIK